MTKKLFFLWLLLLLAGGSETYSQVSATLEVSELQVFSLPASSGTGQDWHILVRVTPAAQAKKVYYRVGTAPDSANVLTFSADFAQNGAVVQLNGTGNTEAVKMNVVSIGKGLSPQEAAAAVYLTLYVEDLQGLFTSRLYYKLK